MKDFDINYIYNEISAKTNNNINDTFYEINNTLMNTFFKKYKINKTIKDIKKIQIDNFSEKSNNGINLFKLDKSENKSYTNNCCLLC